MSDADNRSSDYRCAGVSSVRSYKALDTRAPFDHSLFAGYSILASTASSLRCRFPFFCCHPPSSPSPVSLLSVSLPLHWSSRTLHSLDTFLSLRPVHTELALDEIPPLRKSSLTPNHWKRLFPLSPTLSARVVPPRHDDKDLRCCFSPKLTCGLC